MDGFSGKLFALGLLGVAAALVWAPRVSSFEVGGEAGVDSKEDDLAITDFVYRSRTLKSSKTPECRLLDDPVKAADVTECLRRCSYYNHNCPKFFVGTPWPPSSYGHASVSCRICQTQEDQPETFFATLYNTQYRIPEYTAAAITRDPKKQGHKRDNNLWWRIQIGLCSSTYQNEHHPKSTKVWGVTKLQGRFNSKVQKKLMDECGDCQALYEDLEGCKDVFDKGHINPNHINDKEEDAQDATFSMINMAPQASSFNSGKWSTLEAQILKKAEEIFKKAKVNKTLYVITGTKTSNTLFMRAADYMNIDHYVSWVEPDDWVKGRVLLPRYFWMAVCYPGDVSAKLKPFGRGYYGLNRGNTDIQELSLPDFDKWLYDSWFEKHIFQGSVCAEKDIPQRDEL